jgi:hypothetical protein
MNRIVIGARTGRASQVAFWSRLSRSAWTMLAVASLMFAATSAQAQCGLPTKLVKPTSWHPQLGQAHLLRTALGGQDDLAEIGPSIVGMWHVTFTAQTMNGSSIPNTVIDNALVVWHADKTEIMNSVRPPQDGNFCLGVWEKTGISKYKLNHFAWFSNGFPTNPPTEIGPPVGPSHFTEAVILSPDANHYSGTFTLDAYDTSGNIATSFTGLLTGTRITINTKATDLF